MSVEIKPFLLCGSQQASTQYFLGRIFGQLEVVGARVDRWIAAIVVVVYLADNGQAWLKVGKAPWRQ